MDAKKTLLSLLMTVIFLCLNGCDTSSAITTAASIAYNRYDVEQTVQNNYIILTALNDLQKNKVLAENSHISISTFDYVVLLTGQTTKLRYKEKAQAIVEQIPGVKRVINEIAVKHPNSYLARAQDSWITTKIRLALYASNQMSPSKVKIITENRVVYLMGIVDHREAKIVTHIAKDTEDVKRVVKVFTYVNYSMS